MKDKIRTDILLSIGLIAIACTHKISQEIIYRRNAPYYGTYLPASNTVGFHDNCAVDMTATAKYNGKKEKMIPENKEDDWASFYVPQEALEAEEFTVQATDRDGNKSKSKTLTNLEGIIVEKDNI